MSEERSREILRHLKAFPDAACAQPPLNPFKNFADYFGRHLRHMVLAVNMMWWSLNLTSRNRFMLAQARMHKHQEQLSACDALSKRLAARRHQEALALVSSFEQQLIDLQRTREQEEMRIQQLEKVLTYLDI